MKLYLFGLAVFLLFAGCSTKDTVTEGDRQLSDQNQKAAKAILRQTTEETILEPAKDIDANSGQQLKNWGPPKEAKDYSPANSKDSRDKSEKEHGDPWWKRLLLGAGGIIIGAAPILLRMFGIVAPTFAAGPAGVAVTALVEGITQIRERIQSKPDLEQLITEEELLAILSAAQEKAGVKGLIQGLANKSETQRAPLL